ncbi:MAG: GxxExxY protein [Bacteroidales bacterium]|uniref:GxxExxY protein n=1 Tax=Sodaliphilus sp. TaxID=2815818 RepID=UPI001B7ABF62|nr:GxxExxY protein [Candidatus Sodaliphilus limicaballi]
MEINDLTNEIIGAAIEVHKVLGPGLLESFYQDALLFELRSRGLNCQKEVAVPLIYKGVKLGEDKRIDILVENQIVLELKSVQKIEEVHHLQILSYLRLSNLRYGLLINFNVPILKQGIYRKVNGY